MNKAPLVYIDTNIFSLQLIPKPKPDHKPIQRQQAECFFEDIVNGNIKEYLLQLLKWNSLGIQKE